jgi:hypothetical protein
MKDYEDDEVHKLHDTRQKKKQLDCYKAIYISISMHLCDKQCFLLLRKGKKKKEDTKKKKSITIQLVGI